MISIKLISKIIKPRYFATIYYSHKYVH